MDLDLLFLGTAGSAPTAARGASSTLLRRGGDRLLVDCGEGTQRQLLRSDAGLTDLEHVFLVDCTPADFGLEDDKRLHTYDELTGSPTADFVDVEFGEDHPAVIFYTSGTTGRPKGAISTHRSMVANLQNTLFNTIAGAMADPEVAASAGGGQTVGLLTSPLFHVSGCHSSLVVGMIAGVKLVIPEGRFDPEMALQLIQDHGVTVWATVPTMVWRVCEPDDLLTEAHRHAAVLAARPISSLVAVKRTMTEPLRAEIDAARERENAAFAELMGGPANLEALTAFAEGREPDFSGL